MRNTIIDTILMGIFFITGHLSTLSAQPTNWLIPKTSVTNLIPANLFLTDDDKLFWYNSSKQRFIHVKDIATAEQSPDSRPAENDPEGNWGAPTGGLQLSLRLDKQIFTNGEQIVAAMLLRNVTNVPVKFNRIHVFQRPSPINLLVFSQQEQLPLKGDGGEINVISSTEVTLYPQTQRKFSAKVNDFYDLSRGGKFLIQAIYGSQNEVSSQRVSIEIK